jgi:hypothetical protein
MSHERTELAIFLVIMCIIMMSVLLTTQHI